MSQPITGTEGVPAATPFRRTIVTVRAENPRTSIRHILAEVWQARELVAQFVLRDITVRYTQAVMGFGWALFMPLLIVGAGLLFRLALSTLGGSPVQPSNIASLALKSLPWAFFAAAVSTGTQSIIASANLIGKVHFPRESLPIASVIAQGFDLLVGATVLALLMPLMGVSFSLQLLWAPVMLVLLVLFTTGCCLILSCANLFYRDVKYIVQVLLNFGVFATPVFFEPQMLGPTVGPIMLKLPLSPFIQGLDVAVIHSHNLLNVLQVETAKGTLTVWTPFMLLYAVALAVFVFAAGLRIFRSAASKFAEMA